jgi:O-methyltransferase
MSDLESRSDQPAAPAPTKKSRDPDHRSHMPIHKYRKRRHELDFRPDKTFFELADVVIESKRTLLGYDRLYTFWQAARNLIDVPGEVAEVGSFRGGSAYFIASAFRRLLGEELPVHVFDTFEGHPEAAITEHDPFHDAGKFDSTSYEDVRGYLSEFALVQIHKGDVTLQLPTLAEAVYRLVHIDTDLYQPTVACLDYFGARMSPGGVIVLDDYASRKCPGVPKALSEYMERAENLQSWDMRTEQLMLIKR